MSYQGKIESIEISPSGSEIVADAAIGATELYVLNITDFREEGGTLLLDDVELAYTGLREIDDVIVMEQPLVAAAEADTPVYTLPYGEEKIALLRNEDGDDSIFARVPFSLHALLYEGLREAGSEETALYDQDDDGEFYIVDIVSRIAVYPRESLSIPGLDDLFLTSLPREEFNATVATIEGDIAATVDLVNSNQSETYLAINQAVTDAADNLAAQREALDGVDTALSLEIDQAVTDFVAGLATKSKHTLSPNLPGTTANNTGDVWEQHKSSDATKIIGRWRGGGGTSWTPMNLDATYIPLLDIGSGTFGDLHGSRILAQSVGAAQILVSDFTNLVSDPECVGFGWQLSGTGTHINSTFPNKAGKTGGTISFPLGAASDQAALGNMFDVSSGDTLNCQFDWNRYVNASGNAVFRILWYSPAGSYLTYTDAWGAGGSSPADTWVTTSEDVTVPSNAAKARVQIIRYINWSSGYWIFDNVKVRRKFGGELIVDGSVKAKHIDVNNLNASGEIIVGQQQVSGLDGALTGATNSAVTSLKNLWGLPSNTTLINGATVATGTLLASSIVVSDFNNYAPAVKYWSGTAVISSSPQASPDGDIIVVQGGGVSNTHFGMGPSSELIVKAGDQFEFSWEVYANYSGYTGGLNPYFMFYDGQGNYITAHGGTNVPQGTTGYALSTTAINVPSGAYKMIVFPYITPSGRAAIRNPKLRRKVGGSLIVDGAILAKHVTADMVNGLLVTGRVLQTDLAANRGIKMSTSGLIAYNNTTGAATTSINATTGRISAVGGLATATGYDDIEIVPGNSSLPSALNFRPDAPLYDHGSPARISCFDSSDATYNHVNVRLQGAKYTLGPNNLPATTTPRIDIGTYRQKSNGAIFANVDYHAGGQHGGAGSHYFWIDGVAIASVKYGGIEIPEGQGLGIGLAVGSAPYTGIRALGAVWTHGAFFDRSLFAGGTTTAMINSEGKFYRGGSSRALKKYINPMTLEQASVAREIEAVTFRWRAGTDTGDDGAYHPGFIAEQVAEAGGDLWVTKNAGGEPTGVRYAELTSAHNVLIKDLYAKGAQGNERADASDVLIDDLYTRIESLGELVQLLTKRLSDGQPATLEDTEPTTDGNQSNGE